jgi:hypothetical protein
VSEHPLLGALVRTGLGNGSRYVRVITASGVGVGWSAPRSLHTSIWEGRRRSREGRPISRGRPHYQRFECCKLPRGRRGGLVTYIPSTAAADGPTTRLRLHRIRMLTQLELLQSRAAPSAGARGEGRVRRPATNKLIELHELTYCTYSTSYCTTYKGRRRAVIDDRPARGSREPCLSASGRATRRGARGRRRRRRRRRATRMPRRGPPAHSQCAVDEPPHRATGLASQEELRN